MFGLASLSLAATLAVGGVMVGCGGDDNSGGGGSSTPDASPDGSEGGPTTGDTGAPDSGADSSKADTGTPGTDSGVVDSGADADAAPTVTVATPTFTPAAGSFTTPQSVTIATTTAGATIFYTTDGTNPTAASVVYSAPISVAATTTIRAFATAPGDVASAVAAAAYTINIPAGTAVAPSFSPGSGTQNNDFLASLTTSTVGATICYTTDGSTPTCDASGTSCSGGTRYDAAGQVRISGATTSVGTGQETVKGVTCAPGDTPSAVTTAAYTLQVATPVFQGPLPGVLKFQSATYTPTASSATVGATGMFTQDPNNLPSCTNGRSVGLPGQFGLNPAAGNQAFYIVGCKTGYAPSVSGSATYSIQLNPPAFNLAGGATYFANQDVEVVDSANNEGVTNGWVCGTTDGSNPTCTATGCGTGQVGPLHDGQNILSPLHVNGTTAHAIACTSANPTFADSTISSSGVYTLQLDPIKFVTNPPNSTSIPAPPGVLTVTPEQNNPGGDEQYTFICSTTDGVTVPDCVCATAATQTKTPGTIGPAITLNGTAARTVQAIGCVTPASSNGDTYLPSALGKVTYGPAGATATPTITPAALTQANDTQIQFVNNDTIATVQVCYTSAPNGTAALPTCTPGGAVTCTPNTPPGNTVNGPLLTATATEVRALACDVSASKAPSAEVTPAPVYTLEVGDASIAPNGGPINLGGAITFSTATQNTIFHYLTNGNAPDCATSPTIAAAGATAPFTAVYNFTGTETGGVVKVIACRPGYTQSPDVASATFTPTLATPTLKYGTGTYDDTLGEIVTVSPGIAGTWLCIGTGGGCGATANACTGLNVTSIPTTTVSGVSTSNAIPITQSGQTSSALACSDPSGTVVSSANVTATYTLQTSPIAFTVAPGAQSGPISSLGIDLKPTTTLPQGNGTTVSGVTSDTEICVSTTQSPPPQPAPCAGFTNAAWTCATGGGTSGPGAGVSPIVAFSDIGQNTTYNAFTCRDGFVYQTGSAAYTFTAYAHTIATTGAVADYNAAAEQIHSADAGSFAYVSWDATNLYIGFDKGTAYASSDYVHFYVGGATGGAPDGAGSTDTHKILSPQTLPTGEHALFHVWWKVDNTDQGIDAFTNNAWGATANTPAIKFNQGSSFVEFTIPRTTLGSPTDLHLVGGLWSGAASFGSWPVGVGTPTTDTSWNNFQRELLNAAFVPNDPNQLNQP